MNRQRALLDDLLGYNRDRINKKTFQDINNPEICKYMLAGCCLFTTLKSIKYKYKDCKYKNHENPIKTLYEESGSPNLLELEIILYKELINFYEHFILTNKNEENRYFKSSKDPIKQFYFELKKEECLSEINEKFFTEFDFCLKKFSFDLENLFCDFEFYKRQAESLNEYYVCNCGKVLRKDMEANYQKAHVNSKYHLGMLNIFDKLEELHFKINVE